jgi:hypothetical protein
VLYLDLSSLIDHSVSIFNRNYNALLRLAFLPLFRATETYHYNGLPRISIPNGYASSEPYPPAHPLGTTSCCHHCFHPLYCQDDPSYSADRHKPRRPASWRRSVRFVGDRSGESCVSSWIHGIYTIQLPVVKLRKS